MKEIRSRATYIVTLKKSGNSYYVSVPKEIVDRMELQTGDDLDVTVSKPEVRDKE